MNVAVAKAVAHYAAIDRRVAAKQALIQGHLLALEQSGFPAAKKLDAFVRDLHLFTSLPIVRVSGRLASFDAALSPLLAGLESDNPERMRQGLDQAEIVFRDTLSRLPNYVQARETIDLDSFQDRLLIGILSFQNQCRLACAHCCDADQMDGREHSLLELEAARPKLRFPALSPVTISNHEPLTIPFLIDAVKYLLQEGASVSIVTSGLGVPSKRLHEIMSSLEALSIDHPNRVAVALSFDLFRRFDRDAYLARIAGLLDNYRITYHIKFNFNQANRTASFEALNSLLERVSSDHGRRLIDKTLEGSQASQKSTIFPLGEAVNLLDNLSEAEALLDTSIFLQPFFPLTPQLIPFMLFPGGTIAPSCSAESAHFMSLGNIFNQPASEIFDQYLLFEEKYVQLRTGLGLPSYHALVLAERARRTALGLPAYFVTHFDTLARVMLARDRDSLAHYNKITGWVEDRLASWEGIGLSPDQVAAFCDIARFTPTRPT